MHQKVAVIHLSVMMLFCVVYRFFIDFEKHFVAASSSVPLNSTSSMYFAVAQHTLLGDGGCIPKTPLAKILALIHVLAAWSLTMSFFFI